MGEKLQNRLKDNFRLFDRTFWRFLSGFVLILIVSLSLLAIFGVWRGAQDQFAELGETVEE